MLCKRKEEQEIPNILVPLKCYWADKGTCYHQKDGECPLNCSKARLPELNNTIQLHSVVCSAAPHLVPNCKDCWVRRALFGPKVQINLCMKCLNEDPYKRLNKPAVLLLERRLEDCGMIYGITNLLDLKQAVIKLKNNGLELAFLEDDYEFNVLSVEHIDDLIGQIVPSFEQSEDYPTESLLLPVKGYEDPKTGEIGFKYMDLKHKLLGLRTAKYKLSLEEYTIGVAYNGDYASYVYKPKPNDDSIAVTREFTMKTPRFKAPIYIVAELSNDSENYYEIPNESLSKISSYSICNGLKLIDNNNKIIPDKDKFNLIYTDDREVLYSSKRYKGDGSTVFHHLPKIIGIPDWDPNTPKSWRYKPYEMAELIQYGLQNLTPEQFCTEGYKSVESLARLAWDMRGAELHIVRLFNECNVKNVRLDVPNILPELGLATQSVYDSIIHCAAKLYVDGAISFDDESIYSTDFDEALSTEAETSVNNEIIEDDLDGDVNSLSNFVDYVTSKEKGYDTVLNDIIELIRRLEKYYGEQL